MHTKVKMAGITVEKYDCITHPQQYAEQGVWGMYPPGGCIPQIKTFYYNIIVYIQFYYG